MNINPDDKISTYFTYKEALYLPTWSRMATEEDGLTEEILDNLKLVFHKMDIIRGMFNLPINVHCAYRPPAYNTLVGGAAHSAHVNGQAVDFDISHTDCDTVRSKLLQKLEELDVRMENLPNSKWVHVGNDWSEGKSRYFIP